MMTKTQLPASETGSAAEAYLFQVRKEADSMPDVFYMPKDRQIKRQKLAAGSDLNYEDSGLDIYSIHKLTKGFIDIPRANTIRDLWESAHKALAQEDVQEGQSSKDQWKVFIKSNEPQVLAHSDLFSALRALTRLEMSAHVALWGWCLILQVPTTLTSPEIALLRQIAKTESSELALKAFRGALVEVFRQTDLSEL